MKTTAMFLVVIAIVNISIFMVMNAETTSGDPIIPGLNYSRPLNASGTIEDYEERLNATDVMADWRGEGATNLPIIGDLFSGVTQFWDRFKFLVDGIPSLLDWFGSFLPVSATGFNIVAWAVRAITAIMVTIFVIEFISGREILP
jgi:hypothetical protein